MHKVLLLEDTPVWQDALTALVEASGDYKVVAVVDNYEDALVAFQQHQPDIVLLDFQILGQHTGAEVGYALILQGFPPERMLIVSSASPTEIGSHPFGYMAKNQAHTDLALRLSEMMLSSGIV